ncbi:MAG: hypothetical protein ABIX28_11225 [Vicinamibacterales bacterium]
MTDEVCDPAEPLRVLDARHRDAWQPVGEITVAHRRVRHRQRVTRTRSVTDRPEAAKSFSVRQ